MSYRKKNCVILFFIIFLGFVSLVINGTKRTWVLYVIPALSNFPQVKQLNKIKNTCEYCDFLDIDLLQLEIRDNYKKLYCYYLCFFSFLMAMFSSIVVPKVVS